MCIPLVCIAGAVLLYISMKSFSEHYKSKDIINGVLKGAICSVIGTTLAYVALASFTIISIILLVIAAVCMYLMAKEFREIFNKLANYSGSSLFRTAGTLLWYGALLTIIGVGLVLVWIAYILIAVAFFTIKTKPNTQTAFTPPSYSSTTPAPTTHSTSNRTSDFCPNCGAYMEPGTTFCSNCGKHS